MQLSHWIPSVALPLLLATSVKCAPEEDRVLQLPGYSKDLPFKLYSGFVEYQFEGIPEPIHTHYMLAEQWQQSKSTEEEQPLIFWSNGGPGASSLFGFLTELGPFELNDKSLNTPEYRDTGIPTLFENEYSWNKLGDLLIFDAPAPVGFSYCDDAITGNGTSCGDWDDDRAAENNLRALQGFYAKFPEKREKPLYLSGESYAGVYIPTLARAILEYNDEVDEGGLIPIQGFAVGDACAGTQVGICGDDNDFGPWWDVIFLYGHGQFSTQTYNDMLETCTVAALQHIPPGGYSQPCEDLIQQMYKEVGGYYEYGLYDDCTYNNDLFKLIMKSELRPAHTRLRPKPTAPFLLTDDTCGGGNALNLWVEQTAVKDALHVPQSSYFFISDNAVGFSYTYSEKNLMPFYEQVATSSDLRVLVYNGDTDPSINSFAAQNWTAHLSLGVAQNWRPWTTDGCRDMGGYVTRYDGKLDFLTVRGAGHMVPGVKPKVAFDMVNFWLNDVEFPKYDPNCQHPIVSKMK